MYINSVNYNTCAHYLYMLYMYISVVVMWVELDCASFRRPTTQRKENAPELR